MIEFRVLGSLEVVGQDSLLALGAPKQRALLAVLILCRGEPVSTERLIDELWGERAPASANKIVQGYVSNLRKALGDGVLVTQRHGYLLQIPPGQLDVDRFESLMSAGRQALGDGDARTAAGRLREALQVWRGPVLADFRYESFAQPTIARLEEARLCALEDRIDADLALGEHRLVVSELEALMLEYPTRERLVGQLMLALYRCGRQVEALDAYQRARIRLAEELGLEPGPALRALQIRILEHDRSLAPRDPGIRVDGSALIEDERAGNQDQPFVAKSRRRRPPAVVTATVGRERQIREIAKLLSRPDVHLVTLTGPGGVGKTRIALEIAHELGSRPGESVCWVELAGLARAEDVWPTVASALGLRPVHGEHVDDTLERSLVGEQLLLVLDNFEHVLPAAGVLGRLLPAFDGLTVLATSREPLSLAGEHRVVIGPLEVPPLPEQVTPDELATTPASAMFLAAAHRHDSRFSPTAESAPLIARLCAQVDGLPLGLELTAGATRLLSVQELAVDLDSALRSLAAGPQDAPARHRTLDATIHWSYGLLDEPQRLAFIRFAVFASGATLDAAQTVTGATPTVLQALVDKSLLDRREQLDGTTRLVMLETIRQYAMGQFENDPGRDVVCRRHCDYYLRLVEQNVPRLSTSDERPALATLDAEINNLRAALRWTVRFAPTIGLRLAGQLGEYWRIRRDPEGLQWVDEAIRTAGDGVPLIDRARALVHLAAQLELRSRGEAAIDSLREALELYRRANDHAGMSRTLCRLATAVGAFTDDLRGERDYAQEACGYAKLAGDDALFGMALGRVAAVSGDERGGLLEQAAELLLPSGRFREIAGIYSNAAYVALSEDRTDEATRLLDIALQATSRTDDPWGTMIILGNIGLARLFAGDTEQAGEAFERELRLAVDYRFPKGADEAVAGMAAVAAAEGRDELAVRLRGAARALGYPPATFDKRIDDRLERAYIAPARARYGHTAWQAVERAAAALSYPEATAFALAQATRPNTPREVGRGYWAVGGRVVAASVGPR